MQVLRLFLTLLATPFVRAKIETLLDASISEIQRELIFGTYTSLELVEVYLQRIAEVNDEVHAVIETNPNVRDDASKLDFLRAAGQYMGPLHGIPILIKDNIATKNMGTGAGSVCFEGAKSEDSTVIKKLRRAGAIILGKANMSEWAGMRGLNNLEGWSGRGNLTYGVYLNNSWPSGSSGGSGTAVALGLAAAALGTETAGSIIGPANAANSVGFKPTMGLTSRHLVIPINMRQDTIGPIAHTVTDAATILSAIAGTDPNDNYTSAQPWSIAPDFTRALNPNALRGTRLGVPWKFLTTELQEGEALGTYTAFNKSLTLLEEAGATIVDVDFVFQDLTFEEYTKRLRNYSLKTVGAVMQLGVNRYLDNLIVKPPGINDMHDLYNCTINDPREMYPKIPADLLQRADNATLEAGSAEHWESYQDATALELDGVARAIKDQKLDAVITPGSFVSILSYVSGSPCVIVPMGVQDENCKVEKDDEGRFARAPGMALGLGFTGARWSDYKLMGLAYAFEVKSQFRKSLKPVVGVPKTELPNSLVVQRPWIA